MRTATPALLVCVAALGAQAPASDWKPFSPKDGSFIILLPDTPSEAKKSIKTASGTAEVSLFEVAVKPGDGKYVVGYSEFPESSIKPGTEDKRLDHARDGALASAKGKLKREKSLLLDNSPGRELNIEIEGKAMVVLRMYAVKNRLYEIVAAGSAEFVTSKETAKFLESFKLGK
jgi:hypothetical protein